MESQEIRIRPCRDEEGERLREIAIAAKSHWGYDIDRVRAWAAMGDFSSHGLRSKDVHVAETGGRVVGWTALIQRDDVCWLDDLWIDPEWIGKGIGSRLFRHALERGRELGARRIELEAEPNALGFYEKMGARFLRDSPPGVWARSNPVMGLDL